MDESRPSAAEVEGRSGSSWADAEFEAFFRSEFHRVVALLLKMGASMAVAEDAAASAFAEMYSRWDRVRNVSRPEAYLSRAAINRWHTAYRREATERVYHLSNLEISTNRENAAWDEDPERVQDFRALIDTLASLPSRQRVIMALTLEGYSPSEIAELLDLRPETVRSNLRHARRHLVKTLGSERP